MPRELCCVEWARARAGDSGAGRRARPRQAARQAARLVGLCCSTADALALFRSEWFCDAHKRTKYI